MSVPRFFASDTAPTLGGLFSGIGGFELAWSMLGGRVAWMCEVDPKARKVLEARFPGVPILNDVRELDPNQVEAVDVLTGGSPCQGFSIAGKRTGLLHGESQLFADYVRILDGLAERGLSYAVWENVPGVLSIRNEDGQRTFPHVIGALVGADAAVRLPERERWNAGMAVREGRSVAWRVVDSRHFGVAQRRRRLYACVAFGDSHDRRAFGAVLAFPQGVRRDSASRVTKGQAAAEGVGAGVDNARGRGRQHPFRMTAIGEYADDDTGLTLKAVDHKEPKDLVVPQAFNWQSGGDARGLKLSDRTSALTAHQTPAVMLTEREGKPGGGKGPLLTEEESLTLRTNNYQALFQPKAFRKARRAQSDTDYETWVEDGDANTLNVFDVSEPRTTHAIVESSSYGVRRLTPIECERLQAFPDGWTEPAGSDSARYKALGNAVTVTVPLWLFSRLSPTEGTV